MIGGSVGSALKGKMLVFAIFFLGMVTGALVNNVYETRLGVGASGVASGNKAEREVGQFFDFLGLSAEQRRQWTGIMQEAKPDYDKLFAENRKLTEPNQPKFDSLREQTRSKIRAILTDEQRKQYDEFNESRRRQRQSQSRTN